MSNVPISVVLVVVAVLTVPIPADAVSRSRSRTCKVLDAALKIGDLIYFIQGSRYVVTDASHVPVRFGVFNNSQFFNIKYPVDAAFEAQETNTTVVVSRSDYYTYFFKFRHGPTKTGDWGKDLASGINAIARHEGSVVFFKGCNYHVRLPDGDFLETRNLKTVGLPCDVDAAWEEGSDLYITKGNDVWIWSLGEAVGPACFSKVFQLRGMAICSCSREAERFHKMEVFSRHPTQAVFEFRQRELKRLLSTSDGNEVEIKLLKEHIAKYEDKIRRDDIQKVDEEIKELKLQWLKNKRNPKVQESLRKEIDILKRKRAELIKQKNSEESTGDKTDDEIDLSSADKIFAFFRKLVTDAAKSTKDAQKRTLLKAGLSKFKKSMSKVINAKGTKLDELIRFIDKSVQALAQIKQHLNRDPLKNVFMVYSKGTMQQLISNVKLIFSKRVTDRTRYLQLVRKLQVFATKVRRF